MLLGLVASAAIGGCLLWEVHPVADRAPQVDEAAQTYVVRSRPFAMTVSVVGTIVPGESVGVVAPFDGVVRQASIDYGRAVEADQALLEMDPFDLEQQRREAETTYLKAEEADAEMAAWGTGPDMSRARREVTVAELALQVTKRKAVEAKSLLNRGLIARIEYDALVQEEKTEAIALAAAREDLTIVQKKGEGSSRQVSAITLHSARMHLAALTTQLSAATVRAPAAGVIIRPPAEKAEQGQEQVHAGQHLTRGQLIGTIAKPEGIAVAIMLDEADANRVKEGQAATVTSPGFSGLTLSGRVTRVAGQGTAGDPSMQHGSLFAATVQLDALGPEQARVVRIGMSANATITLYQASSAITVPLAALQGAPPAATIMFQDARSRQTEARKVVIGAVAPDAVEILSGLNEGDIVVWRNPTGLMENAP